MSGTIEIIAAAVDEHNLTMYKKDGTRITIPQGDPRIKPLVEKIIPILDRKEVAVLTQEDLTLTSHYYEAEKALSGVARFFRVVKAKFNEVVATFTNKAEPTNGIVGDTNFNTGSVTPARPVEKTIEPTPLPETPTKTMEAVAEIMKHAAPASAPEFHAPDVEGKETTIVAVMEDGTMIGGMEQIDVQFRGLVGKLGSATGMANFLKRLASVERNHSIQDLLKFMEKGELPIAEDGSVLVYKRLNRTQEDGVFVDVHSGRVTQRVGSYVCMDAKLVDANRNIDCSNGLHIARRDYLNSFGGDVCVLAKLAPEDVIAVPAYDARKLRARAYHIIAELSKDDFKEVTYNHPMKDTVLLGNAIAGNHIGIIEKVEITQQLGKGLVITPVTEGTTAVELNQELYGSSLDHIPREVKQEPTKVDAKDLAKSLVKEAEPVPLEMAGQGVIATVPAEAYKELKDGLFKADPVPVNKPRRPIEVLMDDYIDATTPDARLAAARAVLKYKKDTKRSWVALNITTSKVDELTSLVKKADEKEAPAPSSKKCADSPTASVKTPAKSKPAAKAPAKAAPAKEAKPVKRTRKEEAAHLLELYNKNPDLPNARALVTLKQEAKKGWKILGIDEKLGKRLEERVKP